MGSLGALLVAQENVRTRMASAQIQKLRNRTVPASPAAALPVITFEETLTFYWNGTVIRAFHAANAHTDGDAIVQFPERNVIHMGDTFFNGAYPFIDVDSGGSIDGMIEAVDLVLNEIDADTRLIPGHGPLGGQPELLAYREMLGGARDAIAAALAGGAEVDEVVAAKPTAPWDEQWGKGFLDPATFTRLVATDLSRRGDGAP
jgi:glyoxylase-like metal-dependent hydrolase (beta-lactamase superfamily II)